jgi:uncharacterized membrane protein YbhN (UPF0104 family)
MRDRIVSKRVFWDLFKYALAFGLLGAVVWANWGIPGSNGLGDVWDHHVVHGQPIQMHFLLAGLAIYSCSILITLLRWYILVRAQDLPFTVTGAIKLGLQGIFFNIFLPGSVGGDIVKAAALAREQSLGSVFWANGMLEGASAGRAKTVVVAAQVIVGISVTIWLLLGLLPAHRAERFAGRLSRIPRIGHSAGEFWRAVWMYRCRQKAVALTLLISWIGQVGFVLAFYCCARALWDGSASNPLPDLTLFFLLVPIGLVIQAVPGFPGGAGIGELGFGGLFELFGSKSSNGVLASLVQRVLSWVLGLAGYIVSLRLKTKNGPAATPTEDEPPLDEDAPSCEPVTSASAV